MAQALVNSVALIGITTREFVSVNDYAAAMLVSARSELLLVGRYTRPQQQWFKKIACRPEPNTATAVDPQFKRLWFVAGSIAAVNKPSVPFQIVEIVFTHCYGPPQYQQSESADRHVGAIWCPPLISPLRSGLLAQQS